MPAEVKRASGTEERDLTPLPYFSASYPFTAAATTEAGIFLIFFFLVEAEGI